MYLLTFMLDMKCRILLIVTGGNIGLRTDESKDHVVCWENVR